MKIIDPGTPPPGADWHVGRAFQCSFCGRTAQYEEGDEQPKTQRVEYAHRKVSYKGSCVTCGHIVHHEQVPVLPDPPPPRYFPKSGPSHPAPPTGDPTWWMLLAIGAVVVGIAAFLSAYEVGWIG